MLLPGARPPFPVILALILASYAISGTAPAKAESGLLDAANLVLLPPETNTLLGVDVERLKETTLYRYLDKQTRESAPSGHSEFEAWTVLTGFDPRRDMAELLVVSWQRPGMELRQGQAMPLLAIARGRFDAAKIGDQLVANGATEEEYRGTRIFLLPRDRPPQQTTVDREESIVIPPPVPEALPQVAVAFLGGGIAVAGGYDAIASAIDRRDQGTPTIEVDELLTQRSKELRDGHQLWAVSRQPAGLLKESVKEAEAGTRMLQILQSMSESTLALDLASGLRGRAAALCGAEDDAKLLGDLARGFLATARFSDAGGNRELRPMLDRVSVTENGASVEVVVDIDDQQIEAYLESLVAGKAAVE